MNSWFFDLYYVNSCGFKLGNYCFVGGYFFDAGHDDKNLHSLAIFFDEERLYTFVGKIVCVHMYRFCGRCDQCFVDGSRRIRTQYEVWMCDVFLFASKIGLKNLQKYFDYLCISYLEKKFSILRKSSVRIVSRRKKNRIVHDEKFGMIEQIGYRIVPRYRYTSILKGLKYFLIKKWSLKDVFFQNYFDFYSSCMRL